MSWLLDGASDLLGWMIDRLTPLFVLAFILLLAIAVPFFIYDQVTAETFALRKDEWACSKSVERATTTYVKSGDILVPITTHYDHCQQWSEK